jgi:hypothetical protein
MDKNTLIEFLRWVDENTFILNNYRFFGCYSDYDYDKDKPVSHTELVEKFYEMEGVGNSD